MLEEMASEQPPVPYVNMQEVLLPFSPSLRSSSGPTSTNSSQPLHQADLFSENGESFDRSSGYEVSFASMSNAGRPTVNLSPARCFSRRSPSYSSSLCCSDDILEPINSLRGRNLSFNQHTTFAARLPTNTAAAQNFSSHILPSDVIIASDGLRSQADDHEDRAQRVQQNSRAVKFLHAWLIDPPSQKPDQENLQALSVLCGEKPEDISSWFECCNHNISRFEESHQNITSKFCRRSKKHQVNPNHRYTCPDHDYSTDRKDDLKRHMEIENPPGVYSCRRCGEPYYRKDKFKDHMIKKHQETPSEENMISVYTPLAQLNFPKHCKCGHDNKTFDDYFSHWVEKHCPPLRKDGAVLRESHSSQRSNNNTTRQNSSTVSSNKRRAPQNRSRSSRQGGSATNSMQSDRIPRGQTHANIRSNHDYSQSMSRFSELGDPYKSQSTNQFVESQRQVSVPGRLQSAGQSGNRNPNAEFAPLFNEIDSIKSHTTNNERQQFYNYR